MNNLDTIHLDQHLMIDKRLLNRLTKYADLTSKDIVLEIGAGSGNLTKRLVEKAKKVYAFEIDPHFKPDLNEIKENHPNLIMKYQDILKAKLPKVDKVIANIPYSLSEQIITLLAGYKFKLAVLTLGKNFAELITLKKNNRRIYFLARAYFDIHIKELVLPTAFNPAPRINSVVITITPRSKSQLTRQEFITRELWQQKTKKTKNALMEAIINHSRHHKEPLTQKQAKTHISKLKLPKKILEKTVQRLSGTELSLILKQVQK